MTSIEVQRIFITSQNSARPVRCARASRSPGAHNIPYISDSASRDLCSRVIRELRGTVTTACRCHAQVYYGVHDSLHDLHHSGLSQQLFQSAPGTVTSLEVCTRLIPDLVLTSSSTPQVLVVITQPSICTPVTSDTCSAHPPRSAACSASVSCCQRIPPEQHALTSQSPTPASGIRHP